MFRKIIGTIGTRVFSAFLTLLISALNARLGPSNMGTITLITLSVTYIQLLNNFIGGGALVYMSPRAVFFKLFVSSYTWTFFVTIIGTCVFGSIDLFSTSVEVIPKGYFIEVLVLALIMSFASVNYMLLLGREKVKTFNILNLVQIITLIVCLLIAVYVFKVRTVMAYYWAILISYCISFVFSFIPLLEFWKIEPLTGLKAIFSVMFRYGTYAQFANIFQLFNYRIGYYLVDYWYGRATLGVLGLGFQLSEGLWIISRSLAMVQFTRISNTIDSKYHVRITLILSKIAIVVTTLAVICLVALPQIVYRKIFGPGYDDIKLVIASLAFGIITLSFSMILSHYFSGINKPYHNTISSAIGLVFTLLLGFLLIPRFGLIGASITASISYSISALYQFIIFSKMNRLKPRDFLLTLSELKLLIGEVKNFSWKGGTPESVNSN